MVYILYDWRRFIVIYQRLHIVYSNRLNVILERIIISLIISNGYYFSVRINFLGKNYLSIYYYKYVLTIIKIHPP